MKALIITTLLFFGASAQDTILEGTWQRESRWTTFEGSWKIVKNGDRYLVEMGEDFEAKKAPDLKIFLSKAPLGDIKGSNATKKGDPVFVAKLTSYKGKASYEVPSYINVKEYTTIIVHCEEYAKLWGGSALK